ncbi:hypothetical protein AB0F77_28375 [Streptomyces sp. NPDC026672]|uniref:hypothetical protein n=1 Tax=unclassified Streptomyces TaxID=2593676 RepID=UPI0034027E92
MTDIRTTRRARLSCQQLDRASKPQLSAAIPASLPKSAPTFPVDIPASQLARLDEAGAIELGAPHDLLAGDHIRRVTAGELKIETRR